MKEHPKPYSDFIPKKPKYYTVQELEDLNINEKLKSYIATLRELINSNTDVIKNIVEWRDKSKKI